MRVPAKEGVEGNLWRRGLGGGKSAYIFLGSPSTLLWPRYYRLEPPSFNFAVQGPQEHPIAVADDDSRYVDQGIHLCDGFTSKNILCPKCQRMVEIVDILPCAKSTFLLCLHNSNPSSSACNDNSRLAIHMDMFLAGNRLLYHNQRYRS